jgi:acyl-CoA thioester hydrolase
MTEPADAAVELPPTPLSVPIELRWADTDQYGHVNNVATVRCLEEARIRLLGLPDMPEIVDHARPEPALLVLGSDTYTVVVGQRIEYVREIAYRGRAVIVEAWLSDIRSTSMTAAFRLVDEAGVEQVKATVTIVVMDAATRRPRPISDRERDSLSRHLAAAPAFR